MTKSKTKTTLFLLTLLTELLLGSILWVNFKDETNDHLESLGSQLQTGISTIIGSHYHLIDIIFNESIYRKETIDLIKAANQGDSEQRRVLRGKLYRMFFDTYRNLHQKDIRVLQFVLKDGTSFLRFNRPDLFGDEIASARPTIARTLATGMPSQAFENGRVYPGFRYTFPLLQDGHVIGVVDFSLSFDAMQRIFTLGNVRNQNPTQLLVRKDLLEMVSHPSTATLFRQSPIHSDYVTEDPRSSLRDVESPLQLPRFVHKLDSQLGRSGSVKRGMSAGEQVRFHDCILSSLDCYAVAMQPVPDSLNRTAAYVMLYMQDHDYLHTLFIHAMLFTLISMLILLGGILLHRWVVSRQRLRTISEYMAEGMYVMNNDGKIAYSNPATSEILGYSQQELLGKGAHDLFHIHSDGQLLDSSECPIRRLPQAGQVYRGENELFRRKDGYDIHVSVVSSPFRHEGSVTGSVVLFRDISAQYREQVRRKQTEAAFRNMAEAMVITNSAAAIQVVNRAFTEITGYTEQEVLGKNPRILKSGRHDRAFYTAMWQQLKQEGSWEGELWNRRKNGEIFPEHCQITAIYSDTGKVISYVSTFSDITELHRNQKRLRELAYHDSLTGLHNRTSFLELLDHAILHANRKGSRLALLYLDLDRFKQVNDNFGHIVGDTLLKSIAQRLHDSLRGADVCARLGGDEFIVMLEEIPYREAPALVAQNILARLREPIVIENQTIYMTISIGISIYPEDGSDAITLLKNADSAMYLAKREGRDTLSFFTSSMAREVQQRFQLESELRKALEKDQFILHYQPKIELATGRIVGCEALLRWQHPERGLLPPGIFLDIAHDAGLMRKLTVWVIRSVCRQILAWHSENLNPGKVAINLDSQTISGRNFDLELMEEIDRSGLTPAAFELEITENSLLGKDVNSNAWHHLVQAGFELSIDDFGTGESSLSRLKLLPVNRLKIDKSFVRDIETDENDRVIIHTIIAMAKTLGMKVLAEGVENRAQQAFLLQAGCDEIQGYLFSRPLPGEDLKPLLAANQSAVPAIQDDPAAEMPDTTGAFDQAGE